MTHDPDTDRGPRGVLTPLGTTRWQRREHLRTLEGIVYDGWEVPAEAMQQLPTELHRIAIDAAQSTRDRIRASEALSHFIQQRVDATVQLDRIMRLDAGQATDRVEVLESLTDAQIAAVAAVVKPDPAKAAESPTKPCRRRKPR